MNDFPALAMRPGEYPCEWFLEDRELPGAIDLQASRPPVITLWGDIKDVTWEAGTARAFPEPHNMGRLVGRLRSNHDVVVVDADVATWMPQQNVGHGRYAIVGLGVSAVPGDRYDKIRLQVTGADLLFGVPPLKEVSWPTSLADPKPFSALFNADSRRVWRDDNDGISVDCGYELLLAPSNPYRSEVASAPTVDFQADDPLSLDEWITRWVQPLIEITSLTSRERQRLAWLTVHSKAVQPRQVSSSASESNRRRIGRRSRRSGEIQSAGRSSHCVVFPPIYPLS